MDTNTDNFLYFSPSTLGFYPQNAEVPKDAVLVNSEVEAFLRSVIIWGADTFEVSLDKASVTYPSALAEYVKAYDAPTVYPAQ